MVPQPSARETNGRRSLTVALAVTIFVVALAIRLVGIGWGLKNDLHNSSYHPDEETIFGVSRSIHPTHLNFVPHFYNYGTLYLTILRVTSDVATAATGGPKVAGDGWSPTDPNLTDWDWVARCNLAGRIVNALVGSGIALMAFVIARRYMGLFAATLAGVFIAIAPGEVVNSRFQTVDVVATLFLAVSLYFALRVADGAGKKWWHDAAWCGVFAGLSAGTKYTGVVVLAALAYAAWRRGSDTWRKEILVCAGAMAVAFVITTPGMLLEPRSFARDVVFEMRHMHNGHGLAFDDTPQGLIYNQINLMSGVGAILTLLGFVGLIWAAIRKQQWAAVTLALLIPYYLVIGNSQVKFLRYTLPLHICLAAGFGYAISECWKRGKGWQAGAAVAGLAGLAGVPLGGGLVDTVALTKTMTDTDPRDQTIQYLRTQTGDVAVPMIPTNYTPPFFPDSGEPHTIPWNVRLNQYRTLTKPPLDVPTDGEAAWIWDSTLLEGQVLPERVVVTSREALPVWRIQRKGFVPPSARDEMTKATRFFSLLNKNYRLEKTFGQMDFSKAIPPDMVALDFCYTQPLIYVFRKSPPTQPSSRRTDTTSHPALAAASVTAAQLSSMIPETIQ